MNSLPDAVESFLATLAKKAPGLHPRVEPGGEKAGNWWIDLPGARPITIEWRPDFGFGFSVGATEGFGEGPTEIFRAPERAARRAMQLLSPARATTGLRAVRELYGITQEQIAAKLKKRQAAISRLESRHDSKIETVAKFVQALGGHMEIRAVFPDGHLPIYAPRKAKSSSKSRGAVEPHRATRA